MLVNHADAGEQGILGGLNLYDFPVDEKGAGVGTQQAVENVHQRRFARAVFTEQAMHTAGLERKRDAVEREQRAESLADITELDGEAHSPRL